MYGDVIFRISLPLKSMLVYQDEEKMDDEERKKRTRCGFVYSHVARLGATSWFCWYHGDL